MSFCPGQGGHFCSGLDLAEHVERSAEEGICHSRNWHRILDLIQFGERPVVSAMMGAVIGGGLEIAAATHVRIAEPSTIFQLPEGRRGIFVCGGATVRIGLSKIVETHNRAVVAVAGGIVSQEDTIYHLLSRFHTVWIKASAGEHMDRVRAQGDVRPMEGNAQAMIQLRQILKTRETSYAQADHALDTSGKSVDDSLSELSALIRSNEILSSTSA